MDFQLFIIIIIIITFIIIIVTIIIIIIIINSKINPEHDMHDTGLNGIRFFLNSKYPNNTQLVKFPLRYIPLDIVISHPFHNEIVFRIVVDAG